MEDGILEQKYHIEHFRAIPIRATPPTTNHYQTAATVSLCALGLAVKHEVFLIYLSESHLLLYRTTLQHDSFRDVPTYVPTYVVQAQPNIRLGTSLVGQRQHHHLSRTQTRTYDRPVRPSAPPSPQPFHKGSSLHTAKVVATPDW